MTSNLYTSKKYDADMQYIPGSDIEDLNFAPDMPNNFFSQKCMFLGPPMLIKFDTTLNPETKTYFTTYDEDTKGEVFSPNFFSILRSLTTYKL